MDEHTKALRRQDQERERQWDEWKAKNPSQYKAHMARIRELARENESSRKIQRRLSIATKVGYELASELEWNALEESEELAEDILDTLDETPLYEVEDDLLDFYAGQEQTPPWDHDGPVEED